MKIEHEPDSHGYTERMAAMHPVTIIADMNTISGMLPDDACLLSRQASIIISAVTLQCYSRDTGIAARSIILFYATPERKWLLRWLSPCRRREYDDVGMN